MSQRVGGRGGIGHWPVAIERWALGIDTLGIGTTHWAFWPCGIGFMEFGATGCWGNGPLGRCWGNGPLGMRYWGNGLLGQWAFGAMMGGATLCASGGTGSGGGREGGGGSRAAPQPTVAAAWGTRLHRASMLFLLPALRLARRALGDCAAPVRKIRGETRPLQPRPRRANELRAPPALELGHARRRERDHPAAQPSLAKPRGGGLLQPLLAVGRPLAVRHVVRLTLEVQQTVYLAHLVLQLAVFLPQLTQLLVDVRLPAVRRIKAARRRAVFDWVRHTRIELQRQGRRGRRDGRVHPRRVHPRRTWRRLAVQSHARQRGHGAWLLLRGPRAVVCAGPGRRRRREGRER